MTRRKVKDEVRLGRRITFRLSIPFYGKMKGWLANSNCRSMGEMVRHIICKERIIFYTKDATMDGVAAELAGIKKELRSIGVNVNQVTRYFNSKALPSAKIFEALKILDEYKKVAVKCDAVLACIDRISSKLNERKFKGQG